jgi:hypothetical protein
MLGLVALGCVKPKYHQPNLPTHQMASVKVEERATVHAVDGGEVLNSAGAPSKEFWVSAACHELQVKYEAEYVNIGGGVGILTWSPATVLLTLGASAASVAANTKVSKYETDEPIRFHLPAKAGMKYWVTSTFTGDVFVPRVSVLNVAEERVAVILPNQPCDVVGGKDPAPIPQQRSH